MGFFFFIQVSPRVASLAPDPGQEGGSTKGALEGSQGQREEGTGEFSGKGIKAFSLTPLTPGNPDFITIDKFCLPFQVEIGHTPKKESMLDIFRISYLRKRTLIMGFIWCESVFCSQRYCGASLSAADSFVPHLTISCL